MCSAIFCRMIESGSRSSSAVKAPAGPSVAPESGGAPWLAAGAGDGRAAGTGGGAGAGAPAGGAPLATNARMSSFVTRPWRPVPGTVPRSTPCSAAMRRTSGDERCRDDSASASRGGAGRAAAAGGAGCAGGGGAAAGTTGAATAAGAASAAAAGAASAASPASAMTPMTVSTATVVPGPCTILPSRPLAGAGTSASTLSVEISSNGSSLTTSSPSALNQRTIVPSVIDSPICGIRTLTGMCTPSCSTLAATRLEAPHSLERRLRPGLRSESSGRARPRPPRGSPRAASGARGSCGRAPRR